MLNLELNDKEVKLLNVILTRTNFEGNFKTLGETLDIVTNLLNKLNPEQTPETQTEKKR